MCAVEVRYGKTERELLERHSHLVDLFDIFCVEERDAGTTMRVVGDDAIGFELAQRFAHGDSARSECASKIVLHELLPGDDRAVEDAAADRVGDQSGRAAVG